jgi:hypothetical protein
MTRKVMYMKVLCSVKALTIMDDASIAAMFGDMSLTRRKVDASKIAQVIDQEDIPLSWLVEMRKMGITPQSIVADSNE